MRHLAAIVLLAAFTFHDASAEDWSARLQTAAAVEDGNARVRALMDLYWGWQLDQYPELGTWFGEQADHGRWTDDSQAAIDAREDFQHRLLGEVKRLDPSVLSAERALDYALFRDDLELLAEGFPFPEELMPLNQMGGVQQDAMSLLAAMPAQTVADFEFILSRLEGLDVVIAQHMALMRAGLARGITPPRITLRDVPGQIASVLRDDPFASPLLQPFAERPAGIAEADWQSLRGRAERVYRDKLAPAYRTLHEFVSGTYVPNARENIAATALPDGAAWYAHRVRAFTTTGMSPDEIHEVGLREVARIRARMDEIIGKSGFTGSFHEFTTFLRTDPRFFHDSAEALVREYRDVAKRADAGLPPLFGTLPRNPYGVVAVPDYAARSQTTAYYQPGSLKAGRAGYYFVNTYDLGSRPRWEMEALSLHEAVPGHHLQISLAQELPDVHPLRRNGGYTAFVEGWALYAESLGEQMDFYQDPYSKFGQLTYEMWRAVRLVVDTGMHAKGWSRDRAIQYFKDNSAKTEHDITVEIDRYIVWPGQALAYKLGELKIKELRERAQRSLGERFDIRTFHDRVLEAGALPLNVLEARIDRWIASGGH